MKKEKILLYAIVIFAVMAGTYIGYRIAQNGRYVAFGIDNRLLWDSWKEEPVFKEGKAKKIFDINYKD